MLIWMGGSTSETPLIPKIKMTKVLNKVNKAVVFLLARQVTESVTRQGKSLKVTLLNLGISLFLTV